MMVISCPPESSYVCDIPDDVTVAGFPEILNNPGEEATFNFEDTVTPSGCGNEPDIVLREWTVSNEFGLRSGGSFPNKIFCDFFVLYSTGEYYRQGTKIFEIEVALGSRTVAPCLPL